MAKERHARLLERSGESLEETRRRHVKHVLKDAVSRQAIVEKWPSYSQCSNVERAFLDVIKRSYSRFREGWNGVEEFDKIILYKNDVVMGFLDSEDLEGEAPLIDDLEHVVRAWEEELS